MKSRIFGQDGRKGGTSTSRVRPDCHRGSRRNGQSDTESSPLWLQSNSVCVLDAITVDLLFTDFQTPDLITEDVFVANLGSIGFVWSDYLSDVLFSPVLGCKMSFSA